MAKKPTRKIKIKKSRRGSFTAWRKRQGYSSVTRACIAKGKKHRLASIRKKATFAQNAKGWN